MRSDSDYSLELPVEAVSDLVDIQNYTFTNCDQLKIVIIINHHLQHN